MTDGDSGEDGADVYLILGSGEGESTVFVRNAYLTLWLYTILYVPGLIANILYWREARSIEEATGEAPEGSGCLVALFVVFVGLPAAIIVCLLIFAVLNALLFG